VITAAAALSASAGLVIQLAILAGATHARGESTFRALAAYFAFFTILTNLLVATALVCWLLPSRSSFVAFFQRPWVQAGTAASIVLVGLAYTLLLQRIWDPQGWQLVADRLLHHATPILFVIHWWVAVPPARSGAREIAMMTLYPVIYFAYAMARGALTGSYPYYFIDAGELGHGRAVFNAVMILSAYVAIALLLHMGERWKRHPGDTAEPAERIPVEGSNS
jgi:hypothetical protein